MTAFRLGRPGIYRLSLFSFSILQKPFLVLLFLFFFTSSTDLLNIYFLLFKIKLTNAIAAIFFLIYMLTYRALRVPQKIFAFAAMALLSMAISTLDSPNQIASLGYLIFFSFNYFTYFSIPYNLFRFINPEILFDIYSKSFLLMGMYALFQVLFSFAGIILPGVTQYIFTLARGQGFTYEPSFYALYMTPFTMFCTAKFILQPPSERKIREIFWPNLFLLSSTSTGCFFSYLFFLFFLAVFKLFKIVKSFDFSIFKIFIKFSKICAISFTLLWFVKKELIVSGFLKLFYTGTSPHFTVRLRWDAIIDYLNIFLDYPWVGLGLGAAPTYLLIKESGGEVDLLDPQVLQLRTPMNVTTEIMAGLGILGSLVFLFFFYGLICSFRSALKADLSGQERTNLIALGISVCVMFSTLQFSQSIMRPYMWIHIGLFMGYASYLKEKYSSIFFRSKEALPILR